MVAERICDFSNAIVSRVSLPINFRDRLFNDTHREKTAVSLNPLQEWLFGCF